MRPTGTPAMIGGTEHVPVESIRLKVIRDGLEDHAYLTLLAREAGEDAARAEAMRIASGLRTWDERPEALLEARERVAQKIEAALVPAGTRLHD